MPLTDAVTWHGLISDIVATPPQRLMLAVALTGLSYLVLTAYDFLAFASIGKRLPAARVAVVAFLAYAIAHNVGVAILSGASVRYRFYRRWGVTGSELSRIVFSYSITFWLGLLALGGLGLVVSPVTFADGLALPALPTLAGWLLMLTVGAYIIASLTLHGRSIGFRQLQLSLPRPSIAIAQVVVSSIDWALVSTVLYVLLPPGRPPYFDFLKIFLVAQIAGLASHVPAGTGIFDGIIVLLLKPFVPVHALLPALVVYRAVYYLLPLGVALTVIAIDEGRRRSLAFGTNALLGKLTGLLTPRVLAALVFTAGVILLFSGSTPAASGRLAFVNRLLPLGMIETSHFLASIVGALLLLLSQGLARRLDGAYYVALGALALGVVLSLLKAADVEEALVLGVLLLILWRQRRLFTRHAALLDTPFSTGWVCAIAATLAASVWLVFFAFRHVQYSNELWWQFELHGEASRSLRASVGAAVLVGLSAFARLLGYAPYRAIAPSDVDLADAGTAIAAQASTPPFLVYLRDKAVLFNERRTGFVMYGVRGRSWVAVGDPVCPEEEMDDLIRLFLSRCAASGGVPAFYEVSARHLHHYADFGLTCVKLGEEARVDLGTFTLEGGQGRKFRQALNRLERDGLTFRVVPIAGVAGILNDLREVSDEWIAEKIGGEKQFSLGFFDPSYLSRFPVAVIEGRGRIEAFANLWLGPSHCDLSVDLMRYRASAPTDVMEALLVQLMRWGQMQGYRWFVLGMAPLSGLRASPGASLWNRTGAFLFEHGETLYHFRGLRGYKEKFSPRWESRYLAYPGGLELPRTLANVSALIAGGYKPILIGRWWKTLRVAQMPASAKLSQPRGAAAVHFNDFLP